MANNNNDYEELASLLYPSIEASGNVYYGQTRKLAIDELFSINDGGFESNIKTIRRQTDSNEDGFEYISYFCWKFGPLNGRIRIVPCDNDKFIFTFANFPELEKIYNLDDTYTTNDSIDPIVGSLFVRYKLLFKDNTINNVLNSGTFDSYEKIISVDTNDIRVYITDNCDPTNVDNRDIDDRNIFVKRENDAYYLFVKLCKCADVEKPGDALYFINMNEGESTVKLVINGELQTDYEYYKSSIIGWEKYTAGDVITLANRNDKVYFRGSRSQQGFDNYIQFNMTGKLSAGGDINSLLSHDESIYKNITDYTTFETANYETFRKLFENQSSLYDASLLKLNAHNLANSCYHSMFKGCTSLNQAPELPATTLANSCYSCMFYDCASLVQAPELPATTLTEWCYSYMFMGCTSLTHAPELPATTLSSGCYSNMFSGCTSLVQAPELPAAYLQVGSYNGMFMYCTSLTQAPKLQATALNELCYNSMFEGCTNLIQAPELPATILYDGCYMSMFFGCTGLTKAPELPATELVARCYRVMFYDCSSLNSIKCLATDISASNCTNNWVAGVSATGTFECDNKKYFTLDSPNGIPKGWTITEINPDPDPDPEAFDPTIPFYIENIGDVPVEVGLYNHSPNTQVRTNCKISYDLKTWQNYSLALAINPTDSLIGKITLTNKGDKVYIKADLNTKPSTTHYTHLTVLNSSTDTKIRARGNIASLNKGTDDVYKTDYLTADDHGYLFLFFDCASLIQAPELPATALMDNCYDSMFYNCTSLVNAPALPATTLSSGCYSYMFIGCTSLVQAPELPATTLANSCYYDMFTGCTSLNQAPELSATILNDHCYENMFEYCTSLIQAPELPATQLTEYCYDSMFMGCTSLTQAPELPATTLANSCYRYMFYGCTSLVQAPELPATNLAEYCYSNMFSYCEKLNYVKCLATDTSATVCTDDWLANVASIGTFECDNKKYFTLDSPNGIPKGWTITEINPDIEKPDLDIFNPEIPFCIENIGDVPVEVGLYNHSSNTQIRTNCNISYDLKTWQNYSLALAINPNDSLIGKITLANKGDRVYIKADLNMKPSSSHYTHLTVLNSSKDTKIRARGNIASLNKGTDDAYKTNYLTADDHGYLYLFSDCASLIQAPELPATTLSDGCYMSMFFECRSLTHAPELPATTLAEYCYSNMFENCYGLTQAPTLPATTLATNCYSSMFYYCNNLTQPPELPATNLAEYCYYNMFRSCYGLTQVPVLPATTLAEGVYANMFYNCNKLVAAPDLPAPTLATYCYNSMFRGCPKLNSVKCLATDISASDCTKDWLYNAPATGDFYTPVSTAWLIDNDDGIPSGWTRHDV